MEALTRLVADSLARHGLDRPVDPRRLRWSRWFRCNSPHSLLVVPSKPGIFALADEVMDLGSAHGAADKFVSPAANAEAGAHVGTAAPACPAEPSSAGLAEVSEQEGQDFNRAVNSATGSADSAVEGQPEKELLGGAALQRGDSKPALNAASVAEDNTRRMLAVVQFSEDDDMAFTLDRMFTCINPMRSRLSSGRCFLRFVVIEDQAQRRSICAALNQWMLASAEKASGLPADFSSSLELSSAGDSARVERTFLTAAAEIKSIADQMAQSAAKISPIHAAVHLDSGAATNLHCPQPLPSGF